MVHVAAPHVWDRISPGFNEWLADTASRQRAVEECTQGSGDLERLVEQHTEAGSEDPCGLGPFLYAHPGVGEQDVKKLEKVALDKKDESAQKVADALARIDSCMGEVSELDLQTLTGDLEGVREAEVEGLRSASALLEEIVSPDPGRRRGRDEVLRATLGKEVVAAMQGEAKAKAYKEIRAQRIVQRAEAAVGAAKTLYQGQAWRDKVREAVRLRQAVLDEGTCADGLRRSAEESAVVREEVESIILRLQEAGQTGQQQLSDCKARKLQVSKELDAKRRAFKQALEQLRAIEKEYQDTHIVHEAFRLQVGELESSLAFNGTCLEAAEAASETAKMACDCWQRVAEQRAEELSQHVAEKVTDIVVQGMAPARVAAENVSLAESILASLAQDEAGRRASIEGDLEANEQMLVKLEVQLVAEEPELDIDDVQSDLATRTDQHEELRRQLEECERSQHEVEQAQYLARIQWDDLKGLESFGKAIEEEATRRDAQERAAELYKRLPLWSRAKPRAAGGAAAAAAQQPGAGGASSALVALDPNIQAFIERMIEEKAERKAEQKFQQLRADLIYRAGAQKDGAGSSASTSDAGDASTQAGCGNSTCPPTPTACPPTPTACPPTPTAGCEQT